MAEFAYVARDLSGRKITGKIEAGSQHEALAALDQKALFPLSVEAESTGVPRGRRRIKPQLIATAYGQLADLLRSGVPLLRSLNIMREQASSPALSAVLTEVYEDVEEGRTLAEAMARHPKVFSEVAISMVRAGGEGGFMEEALDQVADFTEQQQDLKGRVIGALAYPVFLSVVGTSVVAALLMFVVPRFEGIFERMRRKGELFAMTDWLLAFSAFLQSYWWLVVGAMVVGFIWLRYQAMTEQGRVRFDRFRLKAPLAGKIYLNFAVARFCRVLGTLLKNGVPILRSLDISSDAAGNRVLGSAIRDASENISAGESLAAPLAACKQFPPAIVEMIAVAEESNSLDTVLVDIASGLERRTWRQLDLVVRLLEPLLLLMLAIAVLFVAIALLVPVIKMGTTI